MMNSSLHLAGRSMQIETLLWATEIDKEVSYCSLTIKESEQGCSSEMYLSMTQLEAIREAIDQALASSTVCILPELPKERIQVVDRKDTSYSGSSDSKGGETR